MRHPEASEDIQQVDGAQAPYEPPAIEVLGSVKDLTEGVLRGSGRGLSNF